MQTIYIGTEEVDAYLRHFIRVLSALGSEIPLLWCPIGPSGSILASRLGRLIESAGAAALLNKVTVARIDYDRKTESVTFQEGSSDEKLVSGACVLILDSSVHSGSTLLKVQETIGALNPKGVSSYSIVLKAGSSTIPNNFGVIIGDHDRAVFLLDEIWNNALMPFGSLRKLTEKDLGRPYIRTEDDDYDKWSWADHWYDVKMDAAVRVFVYETEGRLVGLVKFRFISNQELFLDLVAINKDLHGRKLGGHLIRWAETQGRSARCNTVSAWADEKQLAKYLKMDYAQMINESPINLNGVKFYKIVRKLIYNLPMGI